jgi:hypothetical protein
MASSQLLAAESHDFFAAASETNEGWRHDPLSIILRCHHAHQCCRSTDIGAEETRGTAGWREGDFVAE